MRTACTVALALMVTAGASTQDTSDVAVAGRAVFKGDILRLKLEVIKDECARCHPDGLRESHERVNRKNRGIQNVFVWVRKGLEGRKFAVPEKAVEVKQEKCVYLPLVTGAVAGQKVAFTNTDVFAHNVHTLPKNTKHENVVQKPGQRDEFAFNAEVMVRIGCDYHPHMRAFVGAVPHPHFAVTDADGAWTLPALPPGAYTIGAWHEVYGEREQQVTVEKGMKDLTFEFERK